MSALTSSILQSQDANEQLKSWLHHYAPLPGVTDELIDAEGRPRSHWISLLETLSSLGDEGLSQHFSVAGRRIKEMGVTYRVRGEERERQWTLSHLPLLLTETEWRTIAAGIEQRAELLNLILDDAYGRGRLVSDGVLPAAVVAGSPEYLRPMCGVQPRDKRWISFYAADIARGPDGKWWILGDRTQAPSGVGYALENRLILARTFPSLYRDMNVRRLASFFREFRNNLAAMASRSDPRICLLTPGPWSETYSEHVYLARYLGFLLAEGEDLVVSDGKLHVRTVAGLKRADVLWRRVDADWCDPLEGNAASRIGVPGLFETIRRGALAIANMPGAGVVESRAMMSFMPSLAKYLLGQDLLIPNVATWWCGQEAERDQIMGNFDRFAIAGAFSDHAQSLNGRSQITTQELSEDQNQKLREAIMTRGMDYVGQEIVQLSTTPMLIDGRLIPRPFTLRVFAAATTQGWVVMPGGFCRVSPQADARAISIGAGAKSADVWVLGDSPVEAATLLPGKDETRIMRVLGNLPSRAADNLFWMGRYLERAEATLRIIRCLCNRLNEPLTDASDGRQPIERCKQLLLSWGAIQANDETDRGSSAAFAAATDLAAYGSVLSLATQVKRTAAIVRERLSQDVWQLINRLERRLEDMSHNAALEAEILESVERSLHTISALSGLMDENFNRVAGWTFIDLGRRIERAINTCRFVRQFTGNNPTIETLDALLEMIDCQISYRSRYVTDTTLAPTVDMAMLDPFNPRSVGFQARRIDEHLATLPVLVADGMMERPKRLAFSLRADMDSADARDLDLPSMLKIEQRLMTIGDAIADRYFLEGGASMPTAQRSSFA